MIGEELHKCHKIPTFKNGMPFLNYRHTGVHTDHSSSGVANAKYRDSVLEMYKLPEYVPNHVLNQVVLNNAEPFHNIMKEVNMKNFLNGHSLLTTSSHKPTLSSFNTEYNHIHDNGYIIYKN